MQDAVPASRPPVSVRASVRGLAVASHLGPTLLVTGLSVALLVGLRAPLRTVVVAGAAVLAGQLSVGWSNDWIDAERDAAVGRIGKPVVAGVLSRRALRIAASGAAAACVVLSLATGALPGSIHLAAVAGAWAYNAGLKGTWCSWVPYSVSFALLPAFLVLTLPGRTVPAWLWLTGALLGAGAHVANVLPDLEDDAATGVRGLPHRIGRAGSSVLAPALLVAAAVVVVFGPPGPAGTPRVLGVGLAAVLAIGAGAIGVVTPHSRRPFTLSMTVAAVCVVLLVAAGPQVVAPG